MNVALDIDGTLDAFPRELQSLCSALEAAGHHVIIITGVEESSVTPADVDAKRQYLASLGITMYSQLIVCPVPHDVNKAQALEDNDCVMLIDNSKANIKAATKIGVAALMLWNAKTD